MNERSVVRFLGWFSLALGAAEVARPGWFARTFGARERPGLVRTAYGLREIAAGVGLLASPRPAPWVWARLGGDALDLATFAGGLRPSNPTRGTVAVLLAATVPVVALDVWLARRLAQR